MMRPSPSVVLRGLALFVVVGASSLVEASEKPAALREYGAQRFGLGVWSASTLAPASPHPVYRRRLGEPRSSQFRSLTQPNRPATIALLLGATLAAFWHWRVRPPTMKPQPDQPASSRPDGTPPLAVEAPRASVSSAPNPSQPAAEPWASLLESFPGVSYCAIADDRRVLTSWQGPLERLSGFSREGFLSGERTLTSLIHPDDALAVRTAIDAAIAKSQPYQLAYRMVRADGRTRQVWEQGRAVYAAADSGEVSLLAGVILDLTDHDRGETVFRHQLEQATFFDRLTGLPKRACFLDRLQQTMLRSRSSPGRRFTLLYLDLDRFQLINASFGHALGDALLIEIARRLRIRFGGEPLARDPQSQGPCLARLEGDEFVVLLEDVPTKAAAATLADELLVELFRPF